MRPDTAIFHQHITEPDFQAGLDSCMWGIHQENPDYPGWPNIIIWVRAATKPGCPDMYYFNFNLAGYPSNAPTACPWNPNCNSRLDFNLWPKGKKFVSKTFNYGWNQNALYAPCDRVAMKGHEGWQTQFPDLWWRPSFRITIYLHFIHRLLNSSDYAKS